MPPVAGPQQPNPQLERWLHYKDMILACNAGAIETGIMALKSAILLNGAAAVAVLAFISAQWKEMIAGEARAAAMATSLELFVWGTLVAVIATGFGYARFYEESIYWGKVVKEGGEERVHVAVANGFLVAAIICVVASYVIFVCGINKATDVLL